MIGNDAGVSLTGPKSVQRRNCVIEIFSFSSYFNLHHSLHACTAITSYFVPSRNRKLHQALIMRRFTDSPSRSYNCTFTMMNKWRSNHGHYRNNCGFLFDLRPKLQVFQRGGDAFQVPVPPYRPMRQKWLNRRTWHHVHEYDMTSKTIGIFTRHARDNYFSQSGMYLLSIGQCFWRVLWIYIY